MLNLCATNCCEVNPEFFSFEEIPPHPALKGVVNHYRYKNLGLSGPIVFPSHSPLFQGLIFNFHELDNIRLARDKTEQIRYKVYFVGQAVSPAKLLSTSSQMRVIAVNFTPTGVYRLTGMNLFHLTDKILDGEDIFGKEILELNNQVMESAGYPIAIGHIERFLRNRLTRSKFEARPPVLQALSVLHRHAGDVAISSLHRMTHTTSKTLERSFKK